MGETFSKLIDHAFVIPPPTFKTIPDQKGRVHIITGGYTGVGFELSKALFEKNATVYILGRSEEKGAAAMSSLKSAFRNSDGRVEFVPCDLADLASVKAAAGEFSRREQRLDVLTNNAGVMTPPKNILTAQGHDMQMGTNCLGHFVLTYHLLPLLQRTAKMSPPGAVRVSWASSMAVNVTSPKGGLVWDDKTGGPDLSSITRNYTLSKLGSLYLATEMAARYGTGDEGIVSVAWDPGNLDSGLQRHLPWLVYKILLWTYLQPVAKGVYGPMFAGWSADIGLDNNGAWVIPWGRLSKVRSDIQPHLKRKSQGGGGDAERFWAWCERETKDYI